MPEATSSTAPTSSPAGSMLSSDSSLWQIIDPEIARENPVEDKHRRLIRSHRSDALDRDLKPNANVRDELRVSSVFKCGAHFDYSITSSGHTELRADASTINRRTGSHLEIPLLSDAGKARTHEISKISNMARSWRSQAGC